jgi:hypothetical protein
MKKLILTAIAVVSAASVFAQGTVLFNNYVSGLHTHIYAPLSNSPTTIQVGNSATDTPTGSTSWAGWTLIGAGGLPGRYGGAGTFAQLLGAPGQNVAETSLVPASSGGITSFHTGAGGGLVFLTTATFGNILPDYASGGTFEMVVWDNSSGLYPTWADAQVAWKNGMIAGATAGPFNLNATIGGTATTSPTFPSTAFQSFNLYFIPEPSMFALAGLGTAALLIFRRRK